MAGLIQSVDNSEQVTPSPAKETFNEVFKSQHSPDQPCDVVLVVEDGKEFKAHRKVLSEASPFFEKLLNSGMKESKEGVVRLEMFSESVTAATLEFIYTGHVQILGEDNARDLIVMADYLFLPTLKNLAEDVLTLKLNTSNSISTYYFSERYQCEELLCKTKKFILANFTAVYTANRKDILKMSNEEIEMWTSSDEINVSAEEDVFKIILAWIDHDKGKRKKYFAELFRQVRLVYVSRDFLISDVVTNELVNDNEGCLDLAKNAVHSIESTNFGNVSVSPRKSLEIPALVVNGGEELLCNFIGENSWWKLGEIPSDYYHLYAFFPCKGDLYGAQYCNVKSISIMVSYNPYTNSWMRLPNIREGTECLNIFVGNDEAYALLSDVCSSCRNIRSLENEHEHSTFISMYKPESQSWPQILFLDAVYPFVREKFCIVASENFIYFIGGLVKETNSDVFREKYLSDVDRYDLSKHQWEKVADIQIARRQALGAAVNGKVFIAGGDHQGQRLYDSCEMYNESTNQWQFIAGLKKPEALDALLAADGKVYAVSCQTYGDGRTQHGRGHMFTPPKFIFKKISVECYNVDKNEWEMKTETTVKDSWWGSPSAGACSVRLFKGITNIRGLEPFVSHSLSRKADKRKCFIM
ncbi:kelch-like protein 40 [Oculina patagonica]